MCLNHRNMNKETSSAKAMIMVGKAFFFGFHYNFVEGPTTIKVIEDKTKGATEDTFDLPDAVSAVEQVA